MRKGLLILLAMSIAGCSTTMTLEEMEVAYKAATTQEEKRELSSKLDVFYDNWEQAELYFENRARCYSHAGEYQWYCNNASTLNRDPNELSADAKVRAWRRESQYCSCITNVDAQAMLDNLKRQLSPGMF